MSVAVPNEVLVLFPGRDEILKALFGETSCAGAQHVVQIISVASASEQGSEHCLHVRLTVR